MRKILEGSSMIILILTILIILSSSFIVIVNIGIYKTKVRVINAKEVAVTFGFMKEEIIFRLINYCWIAHDGTEAEYWLKKKIEKAQIQQIVLKKW